MAAFSKQLPFIFIYFLIFFSTKSVQADNSEAFFTPQNPPQLVLQEEMKGLGNNFSAIVHASAVEHYFILDDSCQLFEIGIKSQRPVLVRKIILNGFDDCEGLAILNRQSTPDILSMAVSEESRGTLAKFDLKKNQSQIRRQDVQVYFVEKVTTFWRRNSGLEALAVNEGVIPPIFYLGKEEFPRRIYQGNTEQKKWTALPWNAEAVLPMGSDIAELLYFENSLFVLNERQDRIHQMDLKTGKILSEFKLPFSGWNKYEGLSIFRRKDGDYEMMIAAEKHELLLYWIKK